MPSNSPSGANTRKCATDTQKSSQQEAIPGLPNHIVATHILRSHYFDDPADLARLPVVSRAMRVTVAETGLQFEELNAWEAARLGCVSALKRMQRGGHLFLQEQLVCAAAARSGQLEELKKLRENGCPWNAKTCAYAVMGGHLEVLQWAHANDCTRTTARGTQTIVQAGRAQRQQEVGISSCCSGRMRMGARGTRRRARRRRIMGSLRC